MTKIDQIKHAIHEANFFRSKLTEEALAVPGFTSLKIRHLMNNLGAISTNFCEVGSHVGGCFCSAIFQNDIQMATSVDNFEEFNESSPMQQLLNNVEKFKPINTKFTLICKDCWGPLNLPKGIDFLNYDGPHSLEYQRRAVTQYIPYLADEFILTIDDFSAWDFVKKGTNEGIALAELRHKLKNPELPGFTVKFHQELWNGVEGDNWGYHNGFGVYLCSKV